MVHMTHVNIELDWIKVVLQGHTVVADGLELVWYQSICNHHGNIGLCILGEPQLDEECVLAGCIIHGIDAYAMN